MAHLWLIRYMRGQGGGNMLIGSPRAAAANSTASSSVMIVQKLTRRVCACVPSTVSMKVICERGSLFLSRTTPS